MQIFLLSDNNANPHQRTLLYEMRMQLQPFPLEIWPTEPSLSLQTIGALLGMVLLLSVTCAASVFCACRLKQRGRKCHRPRCLGGKGSSRLVRPGTETSTGAVKALPCVRTLDTS